MNFNMSHTEEFFANIAKISAQLDCALIEKLASELAELRARKGRLFIVGVGGSAANASHAVNDFRKLCGIEAYAPTDNISELTARTNDEGFETVFQEYLKTSQTSQKDALFVLSVGGGSAEKRVSVNIINAIDEALERNMKVLGIVGRDGGYTKKNGDVVVVVPTVDETNVTPHAEGFQGVIWHSLVSNPVLKIAATKW
jgi:D-sedoheptulose 7-phosphate isomerase